MSCGPARAGRTRRASCSGRPARTRARCWVSGRWRWKEGDPQAAADAAERVLRRVPEGSLLDRLPALELLALAMAGLDRHDEASEACAEVGELARAFWAPPTYVPAPA